MNLTSIIFKSIRYNIKNYVAYLLGNSFIICILFMFFNLVCSKSFMNAPNTFSNKEYLISILKAMVAFSVVFILYTTVSFTKYRGKEFGVYFTIGLTSKNIIKILSYENFIVASSSFIFGALGGTIFSKLFYMAITKILSLNNINIGISIKPYIIISIIAFGIFMFNMIYQIIFLKKLSIVQILKASSKKYIGRSNLVIGIIGIAILITSLIVFQKTINQEFKNTENMLIVSVVLTIVSLYLIIGFIMSLIVTISKMFKSFYNNNILCLNSITHRFVSYRAVLYIVTLLVAGAMILLSITYSMYKSTENYINAHYPYDLSFIAEKKMHEENLEGMIKAAGGKIKSYNKLEGIKVLDLRDSGNNLMAINFQILVVSQSSYNKLTKYSVKINKGHAILFQTEKEDTVMKVGLVIDFPKNDQETKASRLLFKNTNTITFKNYVKSKGNQGYLYIHKENVINRIGNISNYLDNTDNTDTSDYSRVASMIINDEDYKMLKKNTADNYICYDVLVNLNNNIQYKYIKKNLGEKLNKIGGNSIKKSLVLKTEKFNKEINSRGFMLFTSSFLGIMFLMGSGAVLYFKTFTSLEDDKNRSKQLAKIGLTYKEISRDIIKEIGTIFLVPPVLAIVFTGYYLSKMFTMIQDGNYMWTNTLVVFGIYGVIQIVFFLLTINKYLRKIRSSIY